MSESGGDGNAHLSNMVNNQENHIPEAVLAEPFPCLMSQWVTRAFDNSYSQLESVGLGLSTANQGLGSNGVRL